MKLKIIEYGEGGDKFLGYKVEGPIYDLINDENPILNIENLVQLCDQNAESRNNHDFVGTHRILSALLFRKLGRKQTTEIMIEIAELGGLDAMSGKYADELTDSQNAWREFGLKEPWHDWSLPE